MRQILFSLPTFPDAPPETTLENACVLAQLLGASLTVQMLQLNSDRATWPAAYGSFPLNFPQLMNEMVLKSEVNAAAAAKSLETLAPAYGVTLDLRRGLTTLYASCAPLVDLARLHDLLVLPVPEIEAFNRAWLDALLFDGGRPVVLLPGEGRALRQLDRIVVAWDHSREAAHALSDALPILAAAREVRIVTVLGEKHISTSAAPADLEKFLAAHKIKHSLHQVSLGATTIGRFLIDYAVGVNADMLVMGAYGHSRLQEFVLGGATREVLREPLLPVLVSH